MSDAEKNASVSGEVEGRPYGPDRPRIPSERAEWLGLVATLILCIVAAVIYFRVTGARGL